MPFFDARLFYLHWPTLGRMLRLNLLHRPRWRRIGFTLVFLALFFLLSFIVLLGRLLDELFYPAYRTVRIERPLFIISNPRSGTTFLHRILCRDEGRFAYPLLYHTILPSVALIRLVQALGKVDRRIGGPLARGFRRLDRVLFSGWAEIHPTGFGQPEEDEGMFIFTLLTPGLFLLCPFPGAFPHVWLPDQQPPRLRRALMRYYYNSLQRYMYATRQTQLTFLSKNVMTTGRFHSLLNTFPDARIVYIIRTPLSSVPSFISMFAKPWRFHSPDLPPDGPEHQQLGELILAFYRYLYQQHSHLPPENFLLLRYDELRENPGREVERIYQHFDLPMTEAFREQLAALNAQQRHYRSGHTYALSNYDLTAEGLYRAIPEVFEHWDFPTAGEPQAKPR